MDGIPNVTFATVGGTPPGRPAPSRVRPPAGQVARRHAGDGQRLRTGDAATHDHRAAAPPASPRRRPRSAPPRRRRWRRAGRPGARRPPRAVTAGPLPIHRTHCQAFTGGVQTALTDSTRSLRHGEKHEPGHDPTPRRSARRHRPRTLAQRAARPGQTANTPTYSAPSPADRPTVHAAGRPDAARRSGPGHPGQSPRPARPGVRTRPATPDRSRVPQPRRSGLVGAAAERRLVDPGLGTGRRPAHRRVRSRRVRHPGLPRPDHDRGVSRRPAGHRLRTGHRHRPPAGTEQPAPGRTKGRRTSVIVATTAALALLAGFGGGLVGAELNSGSSSSADSSLSQAQHQRPRRRTTERRRPPVPCRRWRQRCCPRRCRCWPVPRRAAARVPASS